MVELEKHIDTEENKDSYISSMIDFYDSCKNEISRVKAGIISLLSASLLFFSIFSLLTVNPYLNVNTFMIVSYLAIVSYVLMRANIHNKGWLNDYRHNKINEIKQYFSRDFNINHIIQQADNITKESKEILALFKNDIYFASAKKQFKILEALHSNISKNHHLEFSLEDYLNLHKETIRMKSWLTDIKNSKQYIDKVIVGDKEYD